MDEVFTIKIAMEYMGIFSTGFGIGFAFCKTLAYFHKKELPITVHTFCNEPSFNENLTKKSQEYIKTFNPISGKVVDISCVNKGAKNICSLTCTKCKHLL